MDEAFSDRIALYHSGFWFDSIFLSNFCLLISYFGQAKYHKVMMFEQELFTGQVWEEWLKMNG